MSERGANAQHKESFRGIPHTCVPLLSQRHSLASLRCAQDTSELFFEDLRVPASALLGVENKGFVHVMTELPQERLLIADMAVASAEAVFEWTKDYTMERKAFKGKLSDLQTVRSFVLLSFRQLFYSFKGFFFSLPPV
jgi:alkylation response protein AidB-like acyl-CoA dehydrogenase